MGQSNQQIVNSAEKKDGSDGGSFLMAALLPKNALPEPVKAAESTKLNGVLPAVESAIDPKSLAELSPNQQLTVKAGHILDRPDLQGQLKLGKNGRKLLEALSSKGAENVRKRLALMAVKENLAMLDFVPNSAISGSLIKYVLKVSDLETGQAKKRRGRNDINWQAIAAIATAASTGNPVAAVAVVDSMDKRELKNTTKHLGRTADGAGSVLMGVLKLASDVAQGKNARRGVKKIKKGLKKTTRGLTGATQEITGIQAAKPINAIVDLPINFGSALLTAVCDVNHKTRKLV